MLNDAGEAKKAWLRLGAEEELTLEDKHAKE
jgi:hypothetical protein